MKKNMIKVMAAAMLAAVALAGCTKSELVCDAADSKDIVITANRAAKDAFVLSGSLEVAEGETIRIKPELSRGAVMIELIAEPEEQSMEELPDTEAAASAVFEVSGTGEVTTDPADMSGSYWVRITVTEKATGTVHVIAE
ncbi:MAG: hypothetical protein IKE06_05530 [Solobacterium sp.]|nr:hypothetical protein [Solobacterium sp.]MBR3127174.1 hypothetical protein [Solobacterium sp.]